jgi:hypothetical protein
MPIVPAPGQCEGALEPLWSGARASGATRQTPARCVGSMRSAGVAAASRPAWNLERCQAWLTDDEPPEVVFYCADCAAREFGDG